MKVLLCMESVKVQLLMFVIGRTGLGLHHAQLQVMHHLIQKFTHQNDGKKQPMIW